MVAGTSGRVCMPRSVLACYLWKMAMNWTKPKATLGADQVRFGAPR